MAASASAARNGRSGSRDEKAIAGTAKPPLSSVASAIASSSAAMKSSILAARRMRLSVIIPVYNEEQTIHEVLERVAAVNLGAIEKEIVIANDGSTDGTRRVIDERHLPADLAVHVYHSPINLGKGAAVRLGLAFATGDIMLVQDADLELDPNEYTQLIAPLLDGRADVVYGSRFLNPPATGAFRARAANPFLTMLTNVLFGGPPTHMKTAYKVLKRESLQGIRLRTVGFDIEPEITARLLRAGRRIVEVPISYNPRTADEGKKMRFVDGVDAIYTLLKCRLT